MNVQDSQQALSSTSGQQELFELPLSLLAEPTLQSLQAETMQWRESRYSPGLEPEQYLLIPVPDDTWARYDG